MINKEKLDERNKINQRNNGHLEKAKIKNKEIRLLVLNHYGGKCECCGEDQYEFLAIDHKNGDGAKHRKETGLHSMVSYIIKNNFPDRFRILCHNCNQAIGHYKYCPHQKKEELS